VLAYKHLFGALAAGNSPIAQTLAGKMGNRLIESEEYVSKLDMVFGYLMKYFTLYDKLNLAFWVDEFFKLPPGSLMSSFTAYVQVAKSYIDQDHNGIQVAFQNVIASHERLSVGAGIFANTPDELISVWGVGLLNLVRAAGFDIVVDDPLFPKALITRSPS
jgi:hypothetical protein